MAFNIATDDASQSSDEVIHLTRIGAAYGVSNSDSIDTDFVNCPVDAEQVDQIRSEAVFG
jgi:hypothetical protein